MKTTDQPVIVTQQFHSSPERVWEAITTPELMVKWFFENIPDFKPVPGFSIEFEVDSGNRIFTHQWEITEAIPKHKISYSWEYEEYPGSSILTMKIISLGDLTLLIVIHQTTEDFPENIIEFERKSCQMGWEYFINERLPAFLELQSRMR